MIREALAALLSFEGDMEIVAQVGRGDEVLKAAQDTHPDVAVLDIEMPGLDGLAAAAELKKILPGTKIVILTTFGRPGFLRRAMESGVSAFLVKDSPADKLTQTIRRVLAGAGHQPGPGRRRPGRRAQPAHPARAGRPGGLRGRRDHRRDRPPAVPVRGDGAELPVRLHPEDRCPQPCRGAAHRIRTGLALDHEITPNAAGGSHEMTPNAAGGSP